MQELEGAPGTSDGAGIRIKRIYAEPAESDGFRVLVDRLWPRGMKKETAAIDAWLRELAPSSELRKWFRHDPLRWVEFRRRYLQELKGHSEHVDALRHRSRRQAVTLLSAARDPRINHAVVLQQVIENG
jgi:uncharacterized protein YeaO (DUF488 family)